jgi:hypothetical protein
MIFIDFVLLATSNQDYQFAFTNIVLPPGTGNGDLRCLNITIIDDELIEGNEGFTVYLRLSTTTRGVRLGSSAVSVTIRDDESTYVEELPCLLGGALRFHCMCLQYQHKLYYQY